ncbi:MAG: hypothetical protein AB1806_19670 [Acidobacteriota bacterium]
MSTFGRGSNSPERTGHAGERHISRRAMLRVAGGTALAGIAGAVAARAQITGLMPGGGRLPFRLPLGAMTYLDRNQYISNMEIISHIPEYRTAGGEPLMSMWAKGAQRLLPCGRGWVDVTDPKKPTFVGTGDTRTGGCVAYNTRLRKWLMVVTVAEPHAGRTPKWPYGQFQPEVRERLLAYKGLRGIRVYDITNPVRPNLLSEFSTGEAGEGPHMNFYDGGRYAYLDAGFSPNLRWEDIGRTAGSGLMIVDMTDPTSVKEVSRYWVPGQMIGEEEEYKKYWFADSLSAWVGSHGAPSVPVRVEDGGTVGYGGFGHFGMICFDLRDIKNPKPYGIAKWDHETLGGVPYHTVYPVIADSRHPRLQNLVIGVPETLQADCREPYKAIQVIDVADPRDPRVIGIFPRPKAPRDAPYTDFCLARGRFGSHNIQCWVAPGTSRPEIVVLSFFNAGIRVFDISDPTLPREVAWFVPPRGGEIEDFTTWFRGEGESVFVEWDRNLIWFGCGNSGSYCLSCPALGKPVLEPRPIPHWTKPHLNAGWDA